MNVLLVPLLTGGLPIVAIHVSLVVAIATGAVPSCFPYLDGCMSISATGRYAPASFVFKPAMMSAWLLMVGYWWLNRKWLGKLVAAARQPAGIGGWMLAFGFAGALALILYVAFLGSQGAFYGVMRRFGVYLYFLFTVLAQIILARRTAACARALNCPDWKELPACSWRWPWCRSSSAH